MIINKLIALRPDPRQKVFHTQRMTFRGIDPVPMWIVPDWFAVLLERTDSRRRLRSTKRRSSTRPGALFMPASIADASHPRHRRQRACRPVRHMVSGARKPSSILRTEGA